MYIIIIHAKFHNLRTSFVYSQEYAPTEAELQALRRGEVSI